MGVDRKKLAQLRRERCWEQEDVGRRIGRSQQTVSRWEKGEGNISEAMIQKLARVFGVRPSELLEEEGAAVDPWWARVGDKLSPEGRRMVGEFIEHVIEGGLVETHTIQGLLPEGKEESGQEPSRPNDKAVVRRDKADLAARLSSLGRMTLV